MDQGAVSRAARSSRRPSPVGNSIADFFCGVIVCPQVDLLANARPSFHCPVLVLKLVVERFHVEKAKATGKSLLFSHGSQEKATNDADSTGSTVEQASGMLASIVRTKLQY